MTLEAVETGFVPLSHTLGMGQWDKSGFHGTTCGTSSDQTSLKSLAIKILQRDKPWDKRGTSSRKWVGQDDEKKPPLSHMKQGLSHDERETLETPTNASCMTLQTKDEPSAASQQEQSASTFLERLADEDTNIAALVGWGLTPHLQDGELVIDGVDRLDAENRAGLERWLAKPGPGGEPRRERVIRALKTGRRCAA